MESLESKLDRLSSKHRREVEDFVDFLLQRPGTPPAMPPNPAAVPPPLVAQPLPFMVQEPTPAPEPVQLHDLMRPQELLNETLEDDPVVLLMQEIASGGDDTTTNDYMDYGKFDQPPPSPATETVRRVKEKISQRKEHDPAQELLEWID
jgi:hypothetical protein